MSFDEFIKLLTKEDLEKINQHFNEQQNIKPVYNFSKIKIKDLEKLFDLKMILNDEIFDNWFNNSFSLQQDDTNFLDNLLTQESKLLRIYNEEDLKIHFISPILNRIRFKSLKKGIRDFYEEFLSYETEDFILKGVADFFVAKGIKSPKNPYFFIQEFKRGREFTDPEPQLIAELISAIELNQFKTMKGIFIVGENWNFVILNRQDKHQYEYATSRTFNASNRSDLQGIYKNLLFIKNEIFNQ